jgi:hypothetical protein
MAEHPAALQLRLLQTVVEVAAEKNSTLVLPFPVELLRFLERSTPAEHTTGDELPKMDQHAGTTAPGHGGGRPSASAGVPSLGVMPGQCG